MTDLEYALKQAKKALDFVRGQPKDKSGKLKNRKIAAACGAMLRGMRAKDPKEIMNHAGVIFEQAEDV